MMKKQIYILVGSIAIFSLSLFSFAQALTLNFVTVTPTNTYGGTVSNHTISFMVSSSTEVESQIVLTYPAGFIVSGAGSSTAPSSTGAAVIASTTVSGSGITLWLADGGINVASQTVEVTVDSILNAYAGGSFTIGIQTRTLASGVIDDASSTAFAIIPAGISKKVGDAVPPVSKIIDPTSGLSIAAGETYLISGDGSDTGGSTVNMVEISLDGGKTWFLAPSNASGGSFYWSYNWQNPAEGTHTIKVRSTDSTGNRESPSAGVEITVTGPAGAEISTETPATEVTEPSTTDTTIIQTLQSQVTSLQQQLLGLLLQLVQLLQAQL